MSGNLFSTTVVSSRIRLARNVAGLPFPNRFFDRARAKKLADEVFFALSPLRENLVRYYMEDLDLSQREQYKENYIISETLVRHGETAAVITNPEGSISVMINEEDHIREQYMQRGFCIGRLFEKAMDIDANYIGKRIDYACSDRFGFLTACPTNLGTGLRASVMMFLPAVCKREKIEEIRKTEMFRGFTVRGASGEGSRGDGYLFQVSNEITMGVKEKDLVERLEEIVMYLTEREAKERLCLKESGDNIYKAKDSCGRAYGILSNAEILSYEEFTKLFSELKLGVLLGFYEIEDFELLNDFIVAMRPHNLAMWEREGEEDFLDGEEKQYDFSCDTVSDKDVYRAQCVRQFMERYLSKER